MSSLQESPLVRSPNRIHTSLLADNEPSNLIQASLSFTQKKREHCCCYTASPYPSPQITFFVCLTLGVQLVCDLTFSIRMNFSITKLNFLSISCP